LVLSKLAYLMLCRSIQLLVLLARGDAAKDLKILVLRHQLVVLRRQTPRSKLEPADRALLAAVSRVLPRPRWSCFLIGPETLLRWHRRLVAGAWTFSHHRPTGRPPLDPEVQQLIVRLTRENSRWGYQRIKGELQTAWCARLGNRDRHAAPPLARPSTTAGEQHHGGRSYTSKPPGSWPATSPWTAFGCDGCTCCLSSNSRRDVCIWVA